MSSAAASGRQRHDKLQAEADRLELEARELQDRASRLRQVSDSVDRGNEGEQRIGARLDILDGAGWHVLHDRRKTLRSPANLDHVVIGPAGVFVVDAKNWSGGRISLDARGMRVGRWRRDDALVAVRFDADLVRGLVDYVVPGAPCRAVLAFVQDMGLAQPAVHHGVTVLEEEQLLPWLTELPRRLDVDQVDQIAERLERVLLPRSSPVRRCAAEPTPATVVPPADRVVPGRVERRPSRRKHRKLALVRFVIAVGFVVTLPQTTPVFVEHVATPIAERLSRPLTDGLAPTAPAPTAP